MTVDMLVGFLVGVAAAVLAMIVVSWIERRRAERRRAELLRPHPASPMGQLVSAYEDLVDRLVRDLTTLPSESERDDVES